MQAATTPDLNMQVEFRHRESEQGDLAFNFDPNFFNPLSTRSLDQDTARFGARYSPTPNSDVLLSLIYNDRTGLLTDVAPDDFPNFDVSSEGKTYQAESTVHPANGMAKFSPRRWGHPFDGCRRGSVWQCARSNRSLPSVRLLQSHISADGHMDSRHCL